MLSPSALVWPNRFAQLGTTFFTALPAQALPQPQWGVISEDCANSLGLPATWWSTPEWNALNVMAGAAVWPGMHTLASVYSGHQFGQWAGQLGDGRALYLGELSTPTGGQELQLKGSGMTPYSRMGDGRAVLRSSIREFLCSEAMHALGIPTTRALCLVHSNLPVRRETLETAAVVARTAPSFLRFGHFEHFAHHNQPAALKQLFDFAAQNYFPECLGAPNPALALLEDVSARTAHLIAQWQTVGFVHGVMNTDNMSLLGLTMDYGPFGFLDTFAPGHIFNHTDHNGRYTYAKQPSVAFWNLHALAHALLPLIGDQEAALEALETYKATYPSAMEAAWRRKLGLVTEQAQDRELIDALLNLMAADKQDMTVTFRRLCSFSTTEPARNVTLRDGFLNVSGFDDWASRYAARLAQEGSVDAARAAAMRRANPKYTLRNHLAQAAITQAEAGDFSEVQRLHALLSKPFDELPEYEAYAALPPDWAHHLELSCSS
jgi:serine/tyrosine/threonine adenylyltransferase